MSKKIYPKKIGICEICKSDIIARNSGDNKLTRRFCSKSCRAKWSNPLRIWKEKSKELASKRMKKTWESGKIIHHKTEEYRKSVRERNLGEKSHRWKGGLTSKNMIIRNSLEYKLWRESVFSRDNWTCQICGQIGKKLHPHHIKSFADYPELRFAIDNGITLCEECHKKTENYGNKNRKVGKLK